MLHYNHRMSKDIDLFFYDPQLLGYVSPRINDALEGILGDYNEQAFCTRLVFEEGKIDFILAKQLTCHEAEEFLLDSGQVIYREKPAEIIAKKVYYRGEQLKPRDVFDMAVVIEHDLEALRQCKDIFKDHREALLMNLERMERNSYLKSVLMELDIRPHAYSIRDSCAVIVKDFLTKL